MIRNKLMIAPLSKHPTIKEKDIIKKYSKKQKDKIIKEFSKAYLAETGLKPTEIMMVYTWHENGKFSLYFKRKGE